MTTTKFAIGALLMIIIGAILGNPVGWALQVYTDWETFEFIAKVGGSIMFLGGFVFLIGTGMYVSYQNAKAEEEARVELHKLLDSMVKAKRQGRW